MIPEDVRKELGLTSGSRVRVSVAEDNSVIVINSSVNPQEFVKQTEGLLKRGAAQKPPTVATQGGLGRSLIYVDSNYWIYWLDSRLPEHRHVITPIRKVIRECVAANCVTPFEVAHYLRMLPAQDFFDLMKTILGLSTLKLSDLDDHIADSALKMVPECAPMGLGSRGCVILATMKASGIKRIATHDQAFKKVGWVEVIDDIPGEQ